MKFTSSHEIILAGSFEGSFAEVGQLFTGIKFVSFLTPDMASKNDTRHGIDYSVSG